MTKQTSVIIYLVILVLRRIYAKSLRIIGSLINELGAYTAKRKIRDLQQIYVIQTDDYQNTKIIYHSVALYSLLQLDLIRGLSKLSSKLPYFIITLLEQEMSIRRSRIPLFIQHLPLPQLSSFIFYLSLLLYYSYTIV